MHCNRHNTASAGRAIRLNNVSKRLRLNSVSSGGNDNSNEWASKDAQNKPFSLFNFV